VNGDFLTTYPARQNSSPLQVGTSSSRSPITLANTGNAPLNLSGISILGTNSSDFSQTNNCGSSLVASGNCTVSVTFTPTAAGSRTANLILNDQRRAVRRPSLCPGGGSAAEFHFRGRFRFTGLPNYKSRIHGKLYDGTAVDGFFCGTLNLSCAIAPVVNPAPTCTLSSSSVQVNSSLMQSVMVNVATTLPGIVTAVLAVPYISFPPGAMPLADVVFP